MKKVIIGIIIFFELTILIAVPENLVFQFFVAFPFLFLYFIYRLIKGLMKYHHDLKNGNRANMEK